MLFSVWNDAPHDLFRWVVEQNPFDFADDQKELSLSRVYLFFLFGSEKKHEHIRGPPKAPGNNPQKENGVEIYFKKHKFQNGNDD